MIERGACRTPWLTLAAICCREQAKASVSGSVLRRTQCAANIAALQARHPHHPHHPHRPKDRVVGMAGALKTGSRASAALPIVVHAPQTNLEQASALSGHTWSFQLGMHVLQVT